MATPHEATLEGGGFASLTWDAGESIQEEFSELWNKLTADIAKDISRNSDNMKNTSMRAKTFFTTLKENEIATHGRSKCTRGIVYS